MTAFVTTIRHPRNSDDYGRVGRLLSASLRSVLRQIEPDFIVIVVHNREHRPVVDVNDDRVHYVEVDFPPASDERGPRIDFNAFARDKGSKGAVGLAAARAKGARHVMFFDADDLINHRIASLAAGQPDHPGWYSETGYIHSVGTRSVQLLKADFHTKNGSTSVVRSDLIELAVDVGSAASQLDVVDVAGSHLIDHLLGKHGFWQEELLPAGHHMAPMPFSAAIWMIGTGENVSGNIVSSRDRQPITSEITLHFGLERPSRLAALTALAKLRGQQLRRKLS